MQAQFDLQNFNTLAVPCRAACYWRVSSREELHRALTVARERQLRILLLGGGSNVILPSHFTGLVIHMAIAGYELLKEDEEQVLLRVGAGVVWQDLVDYCLNHNYFGLENLSLIPGTVGAAPIQNIGAYGVELEASFHSLTAVHLASGEERQFDRKDCEFSYRHSIFKTQLKDQYAITDVTFKLAKQARLVLNYAPLRQALEDLPQELINARRVSEAVCRIRRSKLPDPAQIPNAGSFFKNPVVSRQQLHVLQNSHPDIVFFPVDDKRVKLAAAWLLDRAGWKGNLEQGVGMHSQQALVLVNPGRRPAGQILAYSDRVQADIRRRFGVQLEREPIAYPAG